MYKDTDPQETREWIESIEDALEEHGYERTQFLLHTLISYAQTKGSRLPFNTNTPYINTILPGDQVDYPGNLELENHITSIMPDAKTIEEAMSMSKEFASFMEKYPKLYEYCQLSSHKKT